jgi:hypothetical protein
MPVATSNLKLPIGLELADPTFGTSQAINIILGAEIFFDLIINNQFRTGSRPLHTYVIIVATRALCLTNNVLNLFIFAK